MIGTDKEKERNTTLKPLISDSYMKAPAVKLPQLHSGMTSQHFRKFRINWEVFVRMTNMPSAQTLEKAFQESKQVIVKLVRQGVSTSDINRVTCLASDWSKESMGFLLLQKHCTCTINRAPVCCPEGWHLVFAGSRFCTNAEQRYAPIEGEAAVISWALEKCRMFILGCSNVIVVTDHEPLKGLFR